MTGKERVSERAQEKEFASRKQNYKAVLAAYLNLFFITKKMVKLSATLT